MTNEKGAVCEDLLIFVLRIKVIELLLSEGLGIKYRGEGVGYGNLGVGHEFFKSQKGVGHENFKDVLGGGQTKTGRKI